MTEQKKVERPAVVTDEMLEYLEKLRKSGKTNMWGAVPFLRKKFAQLSMAEAKSVLFYWMASYSERKEAKIADLERENADLKTLLDREERRP